MLAFMLITDQALLKGGQAPLLDPLKKLYLYLMRLFIQQV